MPDETPEPPPNPWLRTITNGRSARSIARRTTASVSTVAGWLRAGRVSKPADIALLADLYDADVKRGLRAHGFDSIADLIADAPRRTFSTMPLDELVEELLGIATELHARIAQSDDTET